MAAKLGATVHAPQITLRGVGKSYGGVSVLRDVHVTIPAGVIHSLVGENGAGKSTLLKILGGAVRADEGEVSFDGSPTAIGSPRAAIRRGVSLITQEGALVPGRTALENVFLAQWRNTCGIVRRREDLRRFQELIEFTSFKVDPNSLVGDMSIGQAQQVEILRALARNASVIAMDEPTAVLTEHEKANLLGLIRKLAKDGRTIILVSHFLEEVLAISDSISVLRNGNHVTTGRAADFTPGALVAHMVGRELDTMYPELPSVGEDAPVRLQATDLSRAGVVSGINLIVRAGEIVGLAGLVGSGRTETLRLLFGADAASSGEIRVDGVAMKKLTPRKAIAAGIALVPESRKDDGLVMVRSIRENLALPSLSERRVGPFIRRRAEVAAVAEATKRTDIRAALPEAEVLTLSGGNQQKVLFAKWVLRRPNVLLIDEPTRGVDVSARRQIHQLIADLARSGVAVVVVSSEIEEVMGVCHRIVVLRGGRPVGEFPSGTGKETLLAAAFGNPADPSTQE